MATRILLANGTLQSLLALGFALSLAPSPAGATRIEVVATPFTGDPVEVTLTFDDGAQPGSVVVTARVDPATPGDLRGVFLEFADDALLPGLRVSGPEVTEVRSGGVIDLGQGANLRGGGSPCPCDLGVELGTPGIGRDDLRTASFVLSHESVELGLEALRLERVGVRVTSVGDGFGGRGGSAKLGAPVPEPGALVLMGLGLSGLAASARRFRRPA